MGTGSVRTSQWSNYPYGNRAEAEEALGRTPAETMHPRESSKHPIGLTQPWNVPRHSMKGYSGNRRNNCLQRKNLHNRSLGSPTNHPAQNPCRSARNIRRKTICPAQRGGLPPKGNSKTKTPVAAKTKGELGETTSQARTQSSLAPIWAHPI